MKKINKKDITHISFNIALLIKGIDGILEIIGGILLQFLNPNRLNSLTKFFTQHELSEDPKDVVANMIITLSRSYSISTQNFFVFYLISHGIIKCILIFLLWRGKLWSYPLTIFSLIIFIIYQIYRYSFSQSIFLIILSIFDIIMVYLTYTEYKNVKKIENEQI